MPAIAPDRLLSCLGPLLDRADGSIKSENEVDKIVGLMSKFSKKLVSKCTYINILRATSPPVLDRFMDRGGWELVYNWTNESIESNNFPLLYEICSLLLYSPCSIARMKENDLPKKIKTLSKECQNEGLKTISNDVVNKWISIAKNGGTATLPSSSTSVAVASNSSSSSTASTSSSISSPSVVSSTTTSSSSIPVPMQGKPQIIKLTSPTNSQKVIGGQYCAISNTDGTKLFLRLKPKEVEDPEVICLDENDEVEVEEKDKNLVKQEDNDEVEIIEDDKDDSKTNTTGKKQKRPKTKIDPSVAAKIDQTIEDTISLVSSTSTIDTTDSKKDEEKEKISPIKLYINKNKISPTKGTATVSTKKNPDECSIDTTVSVSNEAESTNEAVKDKKKTGEKIKDTTNKEVKKEKKKSSPSEEPKEKKLSPKESKDKKSSPSKEKELKEKKSSPTKEPKEKKIRKSGSKTIELAKQQAAEDEKLSKKIHEEKKKMKDRAKEIEKEKQRAKDEETLKSVLGTGSMKTLTGKIPKKATSFEDALGGGSGGQIYKLVTHVIKKKPSIDEKDKDKDKNKEKEKSSTAPIIAEVTKRPVRIKVPPSKFRTEDIIHDMMYNQKTSKTKPIIEEDKDTSSTSSTTSTVKTSDPIMEENVKSKPIKRLSSIELSVKGNSPIESKKPKLNESLEKIVVVKEKEKKKEPSVISPTITTAQLAKDKAKGLQESSLFMDILNSSATTKSEKLRKRRPSISTIVTSTISSEQQKSKSPKEEKPISSGGHFFYKERDEDSPPDTSETNSSTNNNNTKSSSLDLEAAIDQDMKEDKDNQAKGFLPDGDENKLKSSLIYLHKSGKAKKKVQFKDEDNLVETNFFEYDETERVNVHKEKEMMAYLEAHGISQQGLQGLPAGLGMKRNFNELKKNEMTMERKSINQRKRFSPQDRMDEKVQWRRPRLVNIGDMLTPKVESLEKQVQMSRVSQILEVIYFPGNPAPDSPAEPDNVIVEEVEPRIMPVVDIQGVTNVTDYSTQDFPPSFAQQQQQPQQGPGLINPNIFTTNFGLPTNFNPAMMQQMPMTMPNPFNTLPQMDMTRPPIFNMPPQFPPNNMMTGPPPFGFGQPPPQMMGHPGGPPPGNFNNFNGPPPVNMNSNNSHRQISPRDSQHQQQQHRGSNNHHRGGAGGGRGRDRGDRDYRGGDRDRISHNRRDNNRDRDRRDSSRPSSRAPAPCRFFLKGNCREGKSCAFSHESPNRNNNSSYNNNKISPPKRNDENSEGSTTAAATDSPKQSIELSNIMALTSSSNTDIILIEPKTRPTVCRTISNQSDDTVTHFAQPPESPAANETSIPSLTPAVGVGACDDDLLPPGCD